MSAVVTVTPEFAVVGVGGTHKQQPWQVFRGLGYGPDEPAVYETIGEAISNATRWNNSPNHRYGSVHYNVVPVTDVFDVTPAKVVLTWKGNG
jgi:hypothetical protein